MEILVIDKDTLTNQLITSRLGAKGHVVTAEANKQQAFENVRSGKFDCILVDPSPLSDAKPVVVGIWKNLKGPIKPYIMLLSKTATQEEAILAGTNDVLNKPLNTQDLEIKAGNALRLLEISNHLAKEDNIHSEGGMIGKAAFNQLYLSAMDRSFRYAEKSLITFVTVLNYDQMLKNAGDEETAKTIVKLTEKMTFMRRQSDVIGRLGIHDFGILLQRPQYETEPLDAINRFSEILTKFYNTIENKAVAPEMELSLVTLPQGSLMAERLVPRVDTSLELDEQSGG